LFTKLPDSFILVVVVLLLDWMDDANENNKNSAPGDLRIFASNAAIHPDRVSKICPFFTMEECPDSPTAKQAVCDLFSFSLS
jgi:hypothetical protein